MRLISSFLTIALLSIATTAGAQVRTEKAPTATVESISSPQPQAPSLPQAPADVQPVPQSPGKGLPAPQAPSKVQPSAQAPQYPSAQLPVGIPIPIRPSFCVTYLPCITQVAEPVCEPVQQCCERRRGCGHRFRRHCGRHRGVAVPVAFYQTAQPSCSQCGY